MEPSSPPDVAALQAAMQELQNLSDVQLAIVTPGPDEPASETTQEAQWTIDGEFPGDRAAAMAHSEVVQADLAHLGLTSSREYIRETDRGHCIRLYIECDETAPE